MKFRILKFKVKYLHYTVGLGVLVCFTSASFFQPFVCLLQYKVNEALDQDFHLCILTNMSISFLYYLMHMYYACNIMHSKISIILAMILNQKIKLTSVFQ